MLPDIQYISKIPFFPPNMLEKQRPKVCRSISFGRVICILLAFQKIHYSFTILLTFFRAGTCQNVDQVVSEQIVLFAFILFVPITKAAVFIKTDGADVIGNDGVDETVVTLQFPCKRSEVLFIAGTLYLLIHKKAYFFRTVYFWQKHSKCG